MDSHNEMDNDLELQLQLQLPRLTEETRNNVYPKSRDCQKAQRH